MKARPKNSVICANNTNPGPAHYNTNKSMGEGQKCANIMGSAIRSSLTQTAKTPGSGTYNISKGLCTDIGSSFDFHCNKRTSRDAGMASKEGVPGPGTYNVKRSHVKDGAPAYSIGMKTESNKARQAGPGPGNYNPNIDVARECSAAMGIGTGKRPSNNGRPDEPGPGHYNSIKSSDNLYCRAAYAFGKSDRTDASP